MKTSRKLILAPNGTLLNADHIVAVSPVFKSPELGYDVFAVYTTSDGAEPFLFAARTSKKDHHKDFVADWKSAVGSDILDSLN